MSEKGCGFRSQTKTELFCDLVFSKFLLIIAMQRRMEYSATHLRTWVRTSFDVPNYLLSQNSSHKTYQKHLDVTLTP